MSTSKMIDLVPANVKFFPAAEADFLGLDKSRQIKVIKALQKISRAPSAFGKELENQSGRPLAGYRSVYVDNRSLRIIMEGYRTAGNRGSHYSRHSRTRRNVSL